jgi:HSP20 family protein
MTENVKNEISVATKPRTQMAEFPQPSRLSPLDEVERLFDRLMTFNWPLWGEEQFKNIRVPQMDVIDRDMEVLIRVEVPGVEKENLDISVSDNTLSIKGSTRREVKEETEDFYRCEISQGNFSRSMILPGGVDSSKISASLKDGVLEVNLPKTEDVQRRSVPIS